MPTLTASPIVDDPASLLDNSDAKGALRDEVSTQN
jgi:hypothetical protein